MRIIAYAYESALHCVDCAVRRFGMSSLVNLNTVDSEWNPVGAIHDFDEIEKHAVCDDCLIPIKPS